MKLQDYKHEYQEFSAKASDITRQLAFAGMAAVWFLRIEDEGHGSATILLAISCALFVLSIVCDMLQYVSGAVIYRQLFHFHEKNIGDNKYKDEGLSHSDLYPRIIAVFFMLKIALVLLGFMSLGWAIGSRLFA